MPPSNSPTGMAQRELTGPTREILPFLFGNGHLEQGNFKCFIKSKEGGEPRAKTRTTLPHINRQQSNVAPGSHCRTTARTNPSQPWQGGARRLNQSGPSPAFSGPRPGPQGPRTCPGPARYRRFRRLLRARPRSAALGPAPRQRK